MTAPELGALIAEQLEHCSEEQRRDFAAVCVTPRRLPVKRFGKIEHVFVVAEHQDLVLYYEDVEEGFNLSPLADDGSIARPGFEQFTLSEALARMLSRG